MLTITTMHLRAGRRGALFVVFMWHVTHSSPHPCEVGIPGPISEKRKQTEKDSALELIGRGLGLELTSLPTFKSYAACTTIIRRPFTGATEVSEGQNQRQDQENGKNLEGSKAKSGHSGKEENYEEKEEEGEELRHRGENNCIEWMEVNR